MLQVIGTWLDYARQINTHYLAEAAGDGLPKHEHEPPISHSCKVEEGEVEITLYYDPPRSVLQGPLDNPADLPAGVAHSIVATKPMTRFTNVMPVSPS